MKIYLPANRIGEKFIKLLQETVDMWNLRISAYCLIPTHYHLLVHTTEGNLSRCMRHIDGVYTQRFNRLHGHDGQLFRGRYKSILVDANTYILWSSMLGSKSFVEKIKERFFGELNEEEIPESKTITPNMDKIIHVTSQSALSLNA